jgi:tetratricopeptide (TPR) repeat protein
VGSDGSQRCPICGAAALSDSKAPETSNDLPLPSTGVDPISTLTYQPAPAAQEQPGQRVPGYEIQGILGRGGMGIVYRARQVRLKRVVALKMILAGSDAGPEQLARFRSEAEAVAALQHPNIVQIYDVGEADGMPYCALEFVNGGSLAQAIRGKVMPPEAAAQLTETLARAIHYSHQRGIIHRDLKPANVLLQSKSEIRNPKSEKAHDLPRSDLGFRVSDFEPKVTDFGLAKQLENQSGQTRSGAVLGTPSYMAPEQAEGRTHEIGPLADVYALGAILYELLTGRPPFRGSTPMETIRQVVSQEPTPPSQFHPRLPPDLETICLKCLAKEPARRYNSALMLAQDLERFRGGESILARREGPARKAWRKIRRRPAAAVGTVALLAAILVAVYMGLQSAAGSRLYALKTFDAGLETRKWTPEVFGEMEALLAEVERRAPDEAADARTRLYARYAQAIRESFAASVDDEQVPAIQANVDLLAERDPDLGGRVREELRARLTRMDKFLVLAAPFDNTDSVFAPASVQRIAAGDRQFLIPRAGPQDSGRILTKVPCRGDVQLEAVFDGASWLNETRLGLMLNGAPVAGRGYTFWLGSTNEKRVDPKDTFARVRSVPGAVVFVRIDRDGFRQREQTIPASALSDESLTLRATRKRDLLQFEIFQGDKTLAMMRFRDIFPTTEAGAGVFGLIVSGGDAAPSARLERLECLRQLRPLDPSPLERGDDLYAQGKLAEALVQYQEQAKSASDSELLKETRCKQGLCLAGLHRDEEAIGILAPLVGETGDRWPVVAAGRLLVVYLAQDHREEADALFNTLSARGVTREQLVSIIPENIRAAILGKHLTQSGAQNLLYFVDAKSVRQFERVAAIHSLFNESLVDRNWSRLFLVRAYRASGEKERTLDMLNALLRDLDPVGNADFRLYVLEELAWVMRERGEPQRGLTEIDAALQSWPEPYRVLLLARARLLIMLGRWDEAERDIEELFRRPPATAWTYAHLSAACLVRGFLRERRGDIAGAQQAWRLGLMNSRVNADKYQQVTTGGGAMIGGSISILNAMILGSLTEDISDQDAALLQTWMANSVSNASPLAGGKELRLSGASIRAMCKSPRAREAARKLAYQNVSWQEFCRTPLVLAAVEIVHQGAFPGVMSAEHETLVWQVVEEGASAVFAGKIKNMQGAQLALAWQKGIMNFLGWKGAADKLEPKFRGRLAYLLGHRLLRLDSPKDAEGLFKTALKDAPDDAVVQRLARAELDKLKAK